MPSTPTVLLMLLSIAAFGATEPCCKKLKCLLSQISCCPQHCCIPAPQQCCLQAPMCHQAPILRCPPICLPQIQRCCPSYYPYHHQNPYQIGCGCHDSCLPISGGVNVGFSTSVPC